MCGFGQCADCGCPVERAGWDDLCFACQEQAELDAAWDRAKEERQERAADA